MAKERFIIGLCGGSGATSLRAALGAVTGRGERMKFRQIGYLRRPLDPRLRERIGEVSGATLSALTVAELDRELAEEGAAAVAQLLAEASLPAGSIAAIGCGGMLAGHSAPRGATDFAAVLELGSPPLLARRSGIAVVGEFARGDIAGGGDGRHVCRWSEWELFHDRRLSRVLVQLGHLAALTFIGAAAAAGDVMSFDAGPGTAIIDALARDFFKRPYDADGAIASRAAVCAELLNELMANSFFQRPLPRTADPHDWGSTFVTRVKLMAEKHRCSAENVVATVTEMTACAVVMAVERLTERPHQVILAGGGARNIHLASRIRALMSPSSTISCEQFGLRLEAMRPACFALLAAARLDKFALPRVGVMGGVFLP